MGADISTNYENCESSLSLGFWKIQSAISKISNQPVSVWVIDEENFKKFGSKSDRDNYIKSCIDSIQQMRRIRHPNILQIIEFDEKQKIPAFASEPISNYLSPDTTFSTDEITYIADQLSSTIHFLHQKAKIGHFNINPSNVLISKDFSIKLCGFNFSSSITEDHQPVSLPFRNWNDSPLYPSLNYTAPEIITPSSEYPITPEADIFSFAAVISRLLLKQPPFPAKTAKEYDDQVKTLELHFPLECSSEMNQTLQICLNYDPAQRPTSSELQKAPAFLGLETRIMRYIDLLPIQDPADKWNFFKGLGPCLSVISRRLIEQRLLPLFLDELNEEKKFAPLLVPIILESSKNISQTEFFSSFWDKFFPILLVTNPPDACLAAIKSIDIILPKIQEVINELKATNEATSKSEIEYVFPIFEAALKSSDLQLHSKALEKLPYLIEIMNEESIHNSLFPRLLQFISLSNDQDILCCTIKCLTSCLNKISHDLFITSVIPHLSIYIRMKLYPSVNEEFVKMLEAIKSPVELEMTYLSPLICDVLSTGMLSKPLQIRLCDLLESYLKQIVNERDLSKEELKNVPSPVMAQVAPPASLTMNDAPPEQTSSTFTGRLKAQTNKASGFKAFAKHGKTAKFAAKPKIEIQHFTPGQQQLEQMTRNQQNEAVSNFSGPEIKPQPQPQIQQKTQIKPKQELPMDQNGGGDMFSGLSFGLPM